MGGYSVPDETNSLSLLTEPDVKTFVKVNCNGKLLPVFEKSRAGDDKVTGFIPATEGAEFSVGWYTGKRKKAKSSTLIKVYFGETLVSESFHLAKDSSPDDPLDDPWRFQMFEDVAVDKDSKQNFVFGKIPTTDNPEEAVKDLEYLDSVSAIRIESYQMKNARWVITGWEDPQPPKKASRKRTADELDNVQSTKASASGSSRNTEVGQVAMDVEPQAVPECVRKVNSSLRPIDEQADKGQFGLSPCFGPIIPQKQDTPSEQDDGVPQSGTAASSGGSLSTPDATLQQSSSGNPAELVIQKKHKKEKKKPIHQLKYDSKKHTSTFVFFLRSLPWISRHLDAFFFQPTPPLPSREPVVELDGAIAVDMTAEEAEEGVRAAARIQRPEKRQHVVDLMHEHEEDEGEGGHDDYHDYSLQDSAAQGGPQGSEAVVAEDDSFSLLADVQVGGTTASQRQAAEEYTRRQASQLVMSLAQEQPEFKKIKQEVFARGSSSDLAHRSETAKVSTDATTSTPGAPSSSLLAVCHRTAAQGWTPNNTAVASGAQTYVHAPETALQGQSSSSLPPALSSYPQQQQQLFNTMPKVKPTQSRTSKTSHGASSTTSSANSAASGSGFGASGARVVGTGSQVGLKR